jgi:hypothetical protein
MEVVLHIHPKKKRARTSSNIPSSSGNHIGAKWTIDICETLDVVSGVDIIEY